MGFAGLGVAAETGIRSRFLPIPYLPSQVPSDAM